MTREELIRELEAFIHSLSEKQLQATIKAVNKKGLMNTDWDDIGCSFGAEDLADFILSRQKLLLDKIGKPLREHTSCKTRFMRDFQTLAMGAERAIKEALAIIEKEGGE